MTKTDQLWTTFISLLFALGLPLIIAAAILITA